MPTYKLKLQSGVFENEQIKVFKFDGGEINVSLKQPYIYTACSHIQILTDLKSSDDIMTLLIVIHTINKDFSVYSEVRNCTIDVIIPYLPYQQSDREFGIGECMGLSNMTNLLRYLPVSRYVVYMPHSENSINLLPKSFGVQDDKFIRHIITDVMKIQDNQIILLSPDSGAYKRMGKLTKNIGFKGSVAAANKYRDLKSGDIESIQLSCDDFNGQDVLIIDDICMGGKTFIGLAEQLRQRNVGKLYLAVSHMIRQFINEDLLKNFDKIFTTNSRFSTYYSSKQPFEMGDINSQIYIYDICKELIK